MRAAVLGGIKLGEYVTWVMPIVPNIAVACPCIKIQHCNQSIATVLDLAQV